VAAETARYCNEPLIGQTGGEDVWFWTTTGSPGTDFKRYRSTGLVDVRCWRNRLGLTFVHPAEQEIVYQLYSPAAPPQTRAPTTWYRKRYTANWHLPKWSCRMRSKRRTSSSNHSCRPPRLSADGAIGRLPDPQPSPNHYGNRSWRISPGATTIEVDDALAWRNLALPVTYALIGAGTAASETRRVTAVSFFYCRKFDHACCRRGGTIGHPVGQGPTLSGGSPPGRRQVPPPLAALRSGWHAPRSRSMASRSPTP
jgi:hypothetical protein